MASRCPAGLHRRFLQRACGNDDDSTSQAHLLGKDRPQARSASARRRQVQEGGVLFESVAQPPSESARRLHRKRKLPGRWPDRCDF